MVRPGDTVLEAIELPDGVVGFGAAEVLYLLACHATRTAERSRTFLAPDADDLADVEGRSFPIAQAGRSSLFARGLLGVDEDGTHVGARGEAALLEYAICAAEQWTRVVVAGPGDEPEVLDLGVILQSDQLTAVLQAASFDAWYAAFTVSSGRETLPNADAVLGLIDLFNQIYPAGAYSVRTWTLDAGPVSLYVSGRAETGMWAVLDDETATAGTPELLSGDELRARMRVVVPDLPRRPEPGRS